MNTQCNSIEYKEFHWKGIYFNLQGNLTKGEGSVRLTSSLRQVVLKKGFKNLVSEWKAADLSYLVQGTEPSSSARLPCNLFCNWSQFTTKTFVLKSKYVVLNTAKRLKV